VVRAALQHAREGHSVLGPGLTDPALLFNGTVYYRGGMTLQALREKIGDLAFFQLLRDWATQNRYGTVTTPEFIALAEKESR
jgi:aminopeptidase N